MGLKGYRVGRRAAVLLASCGLAFGTVGVFAVAQGATAAPAATQPSAQGAASVRLPAFKATSKPAHVLNRAGHPAAAKPLSASRPTVSAASIHETFKVDSFGDATTKTSCAAGHAAGTCTFRAAVNAADADTGHTDAITVPGGVHVVLLQKTPLSITNSMVINGAGASVNGDGSNHVFDISGLPAVQINGLTISGGVANGGSGAPDDGAGIYFGSGSLVLSGVTIKGNAAVTDGGGLYEDSYESALWVDHSLITGNRANTGGGFYTFGSANISNSTVTGNVALDGGGLYNYDGADLITNSTFSYNSAGNSSGDGGGIYNDELLTLVGSSVAHNVLVAGGDGAGLYNEYVLQITGTTFAANSIKATASSDGGAIYDDGDVAGLTNVTVTGTTTKVSGGEGVDGGAVYTDDDEFTWTGGSITGTVNGTTSAGESVTGGALYLDSTGVGLQNVTISSTTNHGLSTAAVEGGAIWGDAGGALHNLTITNTSNDGTSVEGGAIYNEYELNFVGVSISHTSNRGTSTVAGTSSAPIIEGGVIYTDDYVTVEGASISDTINHASDTAGGTEILGGAYYNDEDSVIHNLSIGNTSDRADLSPSATPSSTVSEIDGGAFYTDEEMSVDGMSITDTTATASGGSGEVFGGAWYQDGYSVVTNTQAVGVTVQADREVDGGVLYNDSQLGATNFTLGDGTVHATGSTRSTSPFVDAGVFYNDDVMNVVNGTFSNVASTSAASGGGTVAIDNEDGLILTNSTVANNTESGHANEIAEIYNDYRMSVRNTIVSGSNPFINCLNFDTIDSAGYNIDNGHSCRFTNTGDQQNINPLVGALANNGGPVETAALQVGSAAIDNGSSVGCPTTDARGVARPSGGCDVGSYEFAPEGYVLGARDGGVFPFGPNATFAGSLGSVHLNAPIIGIATDPLTGGYWLVASDGGVFPFKAPYYGGLGGTHLNAPIVAVVAAPNGKGYYLIASDGGVFPFGPGAAYHGSLGGTPLNAPIIGAVADATTGGYWLVASDGGVFPFDAPFLGSLGGIHLNKPVIGIAASGTGYELATSDGGVFPFGAPFYGSLGSIHLNAPIVTIASDPTTGGYRLVASDGGVFPFHAPFYGSTGGVHLNAAIVGAAAAG